LSLVLDGVNGTLGSPVDGVSKVGVVEHGDVLRGVETGWGLESEELLVLLLSPGGELVVANGEGVSLLGVDLVDLLLLLLEDSHSEVVLLLGSVGFAEGGDVLVEGRFQLHLLLAVGRFDVKEASGFAKVKHVCCFCFKL